jgi:hypothetical protein
VRHRVLLAFATGALILAMLPAVTSAAQKASCPASPWKLWDIYGTGGVVEYFWPHLFAEQYGFETPADFAAALDELYDKNGDDKVCGHERGGFDLNPKSHWYQLGVETLGEPTHFITIKDNAANGTK